MEEGPADANCPKSVSARAETPAAGPSLRRARPVRTLRLCSDPDLHPEEGQEILLLHLLGIQQEFGSLLPGEAYSGRGSGAGEVDKVLELPVSNLNMMRKGDNEVWVSTYGTTELSKLAVFSKNGTSTVIEGVHAEKITESDGWIYAIGNNSTDYFNAYNQEDTDYYLYKINAKTKEVSSTHFQGSDLERISNPYCILVNPLTKDIIIADAKDFSHDSELHCFTAGLKHRWSVTTGVGTGHLLLYKL